MPAIPPFASKLIDAMRVGRTIELRLSRTRYQPALSPYRLRRVRSFYDFLKPEERQRALRGFDQDGVSIGHKVARARWPYQVAYDSGNTRKFLRACRKCIHQPSGQDA